MIRVRAYDIAGNEIAPIALDRAVSMVKAGKMEIDSVTLLRVVDESQGSDKPVIEFSGSIPNGINCEHKNRIAEL